jgi:uncharacterized protein (DUF2062 family)
VPRQWLRKKLPAHRKISKHRSLRWLGRLLEDPFLLHLNRHSVSMAVGIGLFITFQPLAGQMLIAASLAILLRANLVISVILVWVNNPLTMPLSLYWNYHLGEFLLGGTPRTIEPEASLSWWLTTIPEIWFQLALGGLMTGSVAGWLGYRSTRILWRINVARKWRRRQKQHQLPLDFQDHS